MAQRLPIVLVAVLILSSLPGCNAQRGISGFPDEGPTPTVLSAAIPSPTLYATPTFPSTWTPPPSTPTNTRVIQLTPTFTPGPSPTPTRLPTRTKALVTGLLDSRTLEVLIDGQPASQGFVVRLLGVELPRLSDPWAPVAVDWLAKEVGRQVVVLESDEVARDREGNLLRYVWQDGRMINVAMVQLGLATTSEDVTDLRFGADLLEAQADAQSAGRGLWGPPPTPTPIAVSVTLAATQTPTTTLTPTSAP